MFENLLVFEKERSWKQALGFYLACLLSGSMIGGLLSYCIFLPDFPPSFSGAFQEGFHRGVMVRLSFIPVFCLVLPFLILFTKERWQNFVYIVIAVLSGLAGMLGMYSI